MKIAIAGAGAMGCRFGYMLHRRPGTTLTRLSIAGRSMSTLFVAGLLSKRKRLRSAPSLLCWLMNRGVWAEHSVCKAMRLDSVFTAYQAVLPAAKVVMILSNGTGISKRWRKYMSSAENLCGVVTLWSANWRGWAYYGHRYRND